MELTPHFSRPEAALFEPYSREPGQHVPLSDLFRTIRRRKWLVASIVLTISLAGVVVIKRMPSYYDATALLQINTSKASLRDLQATVASSGSDLVTIATQAGIIRSAALAAQVVDRLDLGRQAEFSRVIESKPSRLDNLEGWLLTRLGMHPEPRIVLSPAQKRQAAAGMLIGKLSILNDSKSDIISIRARTGSPALSAAIANAYVDVYLHFNQTQKIAAIRRANGLLDEQIAPLAERVTKADEAVEAFRAGNGLISAHLSGDVNTDDGATVADQQLAQINTQLIIATADLSEKESSLHQILEALATGQIESVPEVVSSPLINSLRAQQSELGNQVASIRQTQGVNHPSLRAAVAAEAEARRRIRLEVSKIAASVRVQVGVAQAQVDGLQRQLARVQTEVGQQSKANVSLRRLESEARAARGIYQDYLGRFEQTLNQSNLQDAEADLVSAAETPISKSGPARSLFLLILLLVSAVTGVLAALLRERLADGVRTVEQLETETGLFGLGAVPLASTNLRSLLHDGSASVYHESVSVVGNLLRFGQERFRARVVMITSAIPNEGKTFFATSLAASIGQEGRSALLIDCDLRRPSVAAALGIRLRPGPGTGDALWHTDVLPGVDIITFRPPQRGERKVVSASLLQDLLDEARHRYDMVILDTPPVMPFADTRILSLKADGAVMVVRWRHTPAAIVSVAIKILGSYGARVLGGVVTQARPEQISKTESGYAYMHAAYKSYER